MSRSAAKVLTYCLLAIVNGIVLRNALLHDPWVGYDSPQHIAYIQTLSEFRLPTAKDTAQFFSAPLPYILPALVLRATDSLAFAARIALLQNFVASLILTLSLVRLARSLKPDEPFFPSFALGVLAVLPVYYKSFAFVRGAPLLAMFCVLSLSEIWKLSAAESNPKSGANSAANSRSGIKLGLYATGMALSRQWGVFAVAGIMGTLWGTIYLAKRRELLQAILPATAVVILLAGSFYLSHSVRHDSVRAFNRPAAESLSVANQPAKFYLGTGGGKLFNKPMRPSFANQLLPIFYSEIWGDYWMYFNVYGLDTRSGKLRSPKELTLKHGVEGWVETNRGAALERGAWANRLGLPLTLAMVLASLLSFRHLMLALGSSSPTRQTFFTDLFTGACGAIIFASLAGYGWFLLSYPNYSKGDTIKATYMLHLFPVFALLVAMLICNVTRGSRLLRSGSAAYLVFMFSCLFPQFLSANTKTLCLRERIKNSGAPENCDYYRAPGVDPTLGLANESE